MYCISLYFLSFFLVIRKSVDNMPLINHSHLRSKPDLRKETYQTETQHIYSTATSMCGWRKTMEDAEIMDHNIDGEGTSLFAIFDGHGGGEIAVFAKRYLVKLLLSNENYHQGQYEAALSQIFQQMDDVMMSPKGSDEVFKIKAQLEKQIQKSSHIQWEQDSDEEQECLAGSTAIVCLITKQKIYLACLGDSRCLIAFNGDFKQLSVEHKPDLPEQKKRIQAAGGKVKNHRVNGLLGMSRSIGDFQFKIKKGKKKNEQMVITQPHIESIDTQGVQFILMGCDGVWEAKQSIEWYYENMKNELQNTQKRETILQNLFDHVVAKDLEGEDGYDNMTAILVVNKVKVL